MDPLLLDDAAEARAPAPEPAWDGPAVLKGHRAVGQLLLVDPRVNARRAPVLLGEHPRDGYAVLAPRAGGPALLATAVAPTSSALRDLLDEALAHAPEEPFLLPAADGRAGHARDDEPRKPGWQEPSA